MALVDILHNLLPLDLTRTPYYRSLFRNILLTIIIVSIIPMVVVSSTLYLQFRHSFREKVNDHLRELVQKHQQNIDNFLQERMTDIRLMAARNGRDRLTDTIFSAAKPRLAPTGIWQCICGSGCRRRRRHPGSVRGTI